MFPFILCLFSSWIVTAILQSIFSASASIPYSTTQLMLNEREWLSFLFTSVPVPSNYHMLLFVNLINWEANYSHFNTYCADGQNHNICTSTRLTVCILLFMHQPLMMFGLGSKQQWTTLWLIQKWDRGVGAEERKENPPMYSGTINIGSPDWNGGSF